MGTGIREASGDDARVIATFFTEMYETRNGMGSASEREMLERTEATLFSEVDPPSVFVSETDDRIQGVVAVRHGTRPAVCELVAIQAHDSVQGRGVAQTLLRRVVVDCGALGDTAIETDVPLSDVRARGFLRREGFVASFEELESGPPAPDATIRYRLDVATILASGRVDDHDLNGHLPGA